MDRIQIQIQDTSWWTEDRGQCIQADKSAAVQNTRAGRCVAAACCVAVVVVVAPKGVFSALRALSSFAASNIGCTYSTVQSIAREEETRTIEAGDERARRYTVRTYS